MGSIPFEDLEIGIVHFQFSTETIRFCKIKSGKSFKAVIPSIDTIDLRKLKTFLQDLAQEYFALQTRITELSANFEELIARENKTDAKLTLLDDTYSST